MREQGAKYELNTTNEPYLIRTKEKMNIEKIVEAKYKLIRTFEIILATARLYRMAKTFRSYY